MSDSFTFDSINSATYGVYVFPTNSMQNAPARQYNSVIVPGRSGTILIDNGRYENVMREYGIIIPENADTNLPGLRTALVSRVGYFRLTDTFDTAHYFMAVYHEDFKPEYDWRTGEMGRAKISFECKPQRFLTSGETAQTFTSTGTITNPTRFTAKPMLRVYGDGTLGIGSTNITIEAHSYEYMDIDCETGRAYYGATPLDSYVTLNAMDYPSFPIGNTGVALSGITRVDITPRWWEL